MTSRPWGTASTVGKLVKVLKAIGRFLNQAIIDMTDDRPGGRMAARQDPEEVPPD
jgi:hypothetical protein